jgi:hypothetical protein
VLCGSLVYLVSPLSSQRGLRVIFQEAVSPLSEAQGFPFLDDIKDVVVSGLKPFAEALLGFIPVFGLRGLSPANAIAVAVANPPDSAFLPTEDNSVVFA